MEKGDSMGKTEHIYLRDDGVCYESERLAAIEWSYVAEGADELASELIVEYGYEKSLELLQRNDMRLIKKYGNHRLHIQTLCAKIEKLRADDAQKERLQALKRLGVSVLIPSDSLWPQQMNDLGQRAPLALWVRGKPEMVHYVLGQKNGDHMASTPPRALALVGSRAASYRGKKIASDFAYDLASSYVIASGGAFGIDAAAHRGALAAGGVTAIFSAAGVDRVYPASHADLYREVLDGGGLVISESPLGATAQAHRFLLRNRLIAAYSRATVVVEAPIRSGALSTARAALALGRPVGAVPASIGDVNGVGCNELIRNGGTLIGSAQHVRELVQPIGVQLQIPECDGSRDGSEEEDIEDFFSPRPSLCGAFGQKVLDAVPKRRGVSVESIARQLGVSVQQAREELAKLALVGCVQCRSGRWVKACISQGS